MDEGLFGEFQASEVTPNMDEIKYSEIVNKAKNTFMMEIFSK